MANVTITPNYKIINLSGKDFIYIKEKYKLEVPFEFFIQGSDVGDDTGAGDMYMTIDFATAFGKKYYYCITGIFWSTGDSSQKIEAFVHSDQWENLYSPGVANTPITLWEGAQNLHSSKGNEQLENMLYLGQPNYKDSTPGRLSIYFTDHASTNNYRIAVQGFALNHPLHLSQLIQSNPFK